MWIAATLKDARDIVHLSQKSNTIVAVSENWSYHPLVYAVAEYVQKGGIGQVGCLLYKIQVYLIKIGYKLYLSFCSSLQS